MLNQNKKFTQLSQIEYKQYSKQIILENIGINGQNKLKNAKVLIIGLGGLGSPILLYLISAGIGFIGIVDNDQVDLSNLNRQVLYNINDIDKKKTNCAESAIIKINPSCNIKVYHKQLNQINGAKIINFYDIIIDATDNFKTRYIIDKICYKLHKIHIYGAINQYEGHVTVFNYKNNLRYIDIYPQNLQLQDLNCKDSGIIGAMSGTIGILQATESIKIILGIGKILNGYLLKYNLLKTSFHHIKFNPIKQINQNIKVKEVRKSHFINIKDLINIDNCNYIIVDIRNQNDFNANHQYQSINIPASCFQAKKTIKFMQYYLNQYQIIITCNLSITSSTISQLLNKYEIKTYILKKS